MKRISLSPSVSRPAVRRAVSSVSAVNRAVQFSFALRFYFFGFWFAPVPIRGNCLL